MGAISGVPPAARFDPKPEPAIKVEGIPRCKSVVGFELGQNVYCGVPAFVLTEKDREPLCENHALELLQLRFRARAQKVQQ